MLDLMGASRLFSHFFIVRLRPFTAFIAVMSVMSVFAIAMIVGLIMFTSPTRLSRAGDLPLAQSATTAAFPFDFQGAFMAFAKKRLRISLLAAC